jgi:hypothetical protein
MLIIHDEDTWNSCRQSRLCWSLKRLGNLFLGRLFSSSQFAHFMVAQYEGKDIFDRAARLLNGATMLSAGVPYTPAVCKNTDICCTPLTTGASPAITDPQWCAFWYTKYSITLEWRPRWRFLKVVEIADWSADFSLFERSCRKPL